MLTEVAATEHDVHQGLRRGGGSGKGKRAGGKVELAAQAGMEQMLATLSTVGFGAVNAYALMTFCLLYTPCAATLATIRRAFGSWKWTGQAVLFQLAVAWLVSFVVYHIGLLFV